MKCLAPYTVPLDPNKSVYMVYASKKYREKVEEQVKENPLSLGNIILRQKTQQKYLGDQGTISQCGSHCEGREAKTKAEMSS